MRHGLGTLASVLALVAPHAFAAESGINGGALSPLWVVPFAGILLSIAVAPVTAPSFWHHHFGKTTAFWSLAFLVPFTLNTGLLAIGTLLASVMGTTGAAMLMIRPLLRANDNRRHRAHLVVFFIFLVANIGGALTPLGDPPLFLGFLKGIDFFWTTKVMFWPTLVASTALLAIFHVVDRWFWRREGEVLPPVMERTPDSPIRINGKINFALLLAVLCCVLASGLWKPGLTLHVFGTTLELQNVLRDIALVVIAIASWKLTPAEVRHANHFTWAPIIEVAKLFAGIFLTIIPAIAMLRAGNEGALAPLLTLVSGPDGRPNDTLYFILTGSLSSFLDNASTYLVFFNLAGGDPIALMEPLASTLAAISAGAVFMGAHTYIGNAPNFLVKSMAEARGIKMPSFFADLGWSLLVLTPIYALLILLFFR